MRLAVAVGVLGVQGCDVVRAAFGLEETLAVQTARGGDVQNEGAAVELWGKRTGKSAFGWKESARRLGLITGE